MRAPLTFAALVALGLAAFSPAWAEDTAGATNPDAAQILKSLIPPPKTRGIVPAGKPPEANLSVPFSTGSAQISSTAARVLDELGSALTNPALADFRFRVEGHTDTVGIPESNRALSERRAASVVDYLVKRHGIERERLVPVGMGEEGLLVPTGPNVAEARNRRVLVVNLGR